jgi:hypothetical protein
VNPALLLLRSRSYMEEKGVWIGAAVATLALAAAVYFLYIRDDSPTSQAARPAPVAAAPTEREPEIRNPVTPPPDEAARPLPPLGQSDAAVREELGSVFGGRTVQDLVVPQGVIRRFVISVDGLARKKLPVQSRPVASTEGAFAVRGTEEDLTLDPQNYSRYKPIVGLVRDTDTAQLAALYRRYYPLMQEAYADLDREGAYFNDRMVEVIDHLLATPEPQGPIKLTQPRVFYEFADPELEALSAGQKVLIRMGPENAAVVKGKLRELRQVIAAQEAPDA